MGTVTRLSAWPKPIAHRAPKAVEVRPRTVTTSGAEVVTATLAPPEKPAPPKAAPKPKAERKPKAPPKPKAEKKG